MGFTLTHGCLSQAHFGFAQGRAAPSLSSSSTCRGEPCHRPLPDQLSFELGQCCKDAEYELAASGGRVNAGSLASQHLEADSPILEVLDKGDQVAQASPESIELPDDQEITLSDGLETPLQARPLLAFA